jgi:hypothetical protein
MTLAEFKATLGDPRPPAVAPALVALWHDAKGDWNEAHETAQAIEDVTGAWVHAYLHRKEGDASNAAYWYRRAGRDAVGRGVSLDEEWSQIATELLSARTR